MAMVDFAGFENHQVFGYNDGFEPGFGPGRDSRVGLARIFREDGSQGSFVLATGKSTYPSGGGLVLGMAVKMGDAGVWGTDGLLLASIGTAGNDVSLMMETSSGPQIVVLRYGLGVDPPTEWGRVVMPAGYTPNSWAYVEVKVRWGTGDGSLAIHIDGIEVLFLTGLDYWITTQAEMGDLTLTPEKTWGGGVGEILYIDDVYVIDDDDSAGSGYITYLGDMHVGMLQPVADGSYTEWYGAWPYGEPHWFVMSPNPDVPGNVFPYTGDDGSSSPAPYTDTYRYAPLPNTDDVPAIRVFTYTGIGNDGTYEWGGDTRFVPGAGTGVEVNAGEWLGYGTSGWGISHIFTYNPMLSGTQTWTAAAINAMEAGPTITLTSGWLYCGYFAIEYIQKTPPRGGRRPFAQYFNAYGHGA